VEPHRSLDSDTVVKVVATRFAFFTGKGGVGKTSLACATAVTLADLGKRVLLVSTDPASNLDETFGVKLTSQPTQVPGVPRLFALNVEPEAAAEAYRARVIEPMLGRASQIEIDGLREQLSGACTTEIAAFDEFAALLADDAAGRDFDHVLFDTAPTGHTLRLLSLPKAWTQFFDVNERGASCLGPHSALKNQQARFEAAFANLSNPNATTVVLVARTDQGSIREAAKTASDLAGLGLTRQVFIVNAVFRATDASDPLAAKLEVYANVSLRDLPPSLAGLESFIVPLRPFNTVGLAAIRRLLAVDAATVLEVPLESPAKPEATWSLKSLVDDLASRSHALVLVMGKGGVGKTTVAASIAVALAKRGINVHLSTTDPAAHIAGTVAGAFANLKISKIDPNAETAAYTEKILASKGKNLDAEGREMLVEDLASPCTEEVAVFHAFSRIVMESRRGIVILDTAPTGHTLLLLDAAGSYHREMLRRMEGFGAGRTITPLMQLKDPEQSKVLLVTLPETTPVSEAAALQEDLRRAGVEPAGWVINRCLSASEVKDPLLVERARLEAAEIERVTRGLAKKVAIVPWTIEPPVGAERLQKLVDG
jgi:arsenite-transporting ATPase